MERYQKTVLDNGIRVVTETIPTLESVSLGLWITTGSRDETPQENGISHFIEHLFFKGTDSRSAFDITRAIESVGGSINAFTGKEYTCIHAKVLQNDIALALDVVTDIFANSIFDPEELEREKMVVLQEVKMIEDTPEDLIHDLFNRFFWADNGLGFPVTGTQENILSFQQSQIKTFFRNHYTSGKVIVAVAGRMHHQQVVDLIASRLDRCQPSPSASSREEPQGGRNGIRVAHRELEQVHLCMGTRGIPHCHKLRFAGHTLNILLGGNMSSRLFQEIREKRGLTYSIFSFLNTYEDTGLFGVYAGTTKEEIQDVIELILRELRNVKEGKIREEELKVAKEYLKGGLILGQESSEGRMSRLAKNEMHWGRHVSLQEALEELEGVTQDDVGDVAREMLGSDTLCLTLLGTIEESELPWESLGL